MGCQPRPCASGQRLGAVALRSYQQGRKEWSESATSGEVDSIASQGLAEKGISI